MSFWAVSVRSTLLMIPQNFQYSYFTAVQLIAQVLSQLVVIKLPQLSLFLQSRAKALPCSHSIARGPSNHIFSSISAFLSHVSNMGALFSVAKPTQTVPPHLVLMSFYPTSLMGLILYSKSGNLGPTTLSFPLKSSVRKTSFSTHSAMISLHYRNVLSIFGGEGVMWYSATTRYTNQHPEMISVHMSSWLE